MKAFFVSIVFSISFSAVYANDCSRLEGTFSCNGETVTISSVSDTARVSTFDISGLNIVADGQEHPFPASMSAGHQNVGYRAHCDREKLKIFLVYNEQNSKKLITTAGAEYWLDQIEDSLYTNILTVHYDITYDPPIVSFLNNVTRCERVQATTPLIF